MTCGDLHLLINLSPPQAGEYAKSLHDSVTSVTIPLPGHTPPTSLPLYPSLPPLAQVKIKTPWPENYIHPIHGDSRYRPQSAPVGCRAAPKAMINLHLRSY